MQELNDIIDRLKNFLKKVDEGDLYQEIYENTLMFIALEQLKKFKKLKEEINNK